MKLTITSKKDRERNDKKTSAHQFTGVDRIRALVRTLNNEAMKTIILPYQSDEDIKRAEKKYFSLVHKFNTVTVLPLQNGSKIKITYQ